TGRGCVVGPSPEGRNLDTRTWRKLRSAADSALESLRMHRDRRSRFPPPGFVRVRAWLAFAAVFLGAAQTARAAKYDVDLARLTSSANGVVQPRYGDFRSLSSELGTLLAPRPM